MNDYHHELRQTPEYKAEEAERNAREIERKTQLLATKSSQGYKSSLQSEKEEILKFFKANNYRQLFPGQNKFKPHGQQECDGASKESNAPQEKQACLLPLF
jgi:hypothetical protein